MRTHTHARIIEDGHIIAVLNARANRTSTDLLGFSLDEGHFNVSIHYMHNNTKPLRDYEQSKIYRECISFGMVYVKRLKVTNN